MQGTSTWRRCLTGTIANEPKGPSVTTEIPGPQSRSLLQELNAIQVCQLSILLDCHAKFTYIGSLIELPLAEICLDFSKHPLYNSS